MSFVFQKRFFFLFFFTLFLNTALWAEEKKEVQNFWRYDFRQAGKIAKKEYKLLLLFFTISDSSLPLNKKMLYLYRYNQTFLKASAPDYILLHIDLPADPEKLSLKHRRQNERLKSRFSVRSFPAFVLVDPVTPWGAMLYRRYGMISPPELLNIFDRKFASRLKKLRSSRSSRSLAANRKKTPPPPPAASSAVSGKGEKKGEEK